MEREISVRMLNQQTSAVLNEVAAGTAFTVSSAGKPVARIVPLVALPPGLAELVAEGTAVSPTHTGPVSLPPMTPRSDMDVAAALERDREAERW